MMFHTTGIAKRMACGQEREPFLRLISEKRLARTSNRVLAATESEKKLLMKYYDVPAENIGVVPCGVSLQRFHPVARGLAREELGLHDSQFIALYVGRFAPVKGLERLLAAAVHLRFRQGLRFVIVGGDDQKTAVSTELRSLYKRASLGGVVQFQGRIEHNLLPLYYSAADVLVVPSYYESFGMVALESLACGTPVIATRVGAMDSLIQDGMTGFLIDSPSPLLLASAIESIMVAQSNRRICRDQIRASVLGYGWSDVASAIAREYATVFQPVAHKKVITRK
jgi:D-inositol-3-phosphate glycosyltransferase